MERDKQNINKHKTNKNKYNYCISREASLQLGSKRRQLWGPNETAHPHPKLSQVFFVPDRLQLYRQTVRQTETDKIIYIFTLTFDLTRDFYCHLDVFGSASGSSVPPAHFRTETV